MDCPADDMTAGADDAARTRTATLVIISILLCVAAVYVVGLLLIL